MKENITNDNFVKTLTSLSLSQQRYLGAKFISSILDVINEQRLKKLIDDIKKDGNTADELHSAYNIAHAIYVESHPQSDLREIDFSRQAIHMLAEACIACLAPIYEEAKTVHLASKVATYCRMAITCFNMPHDQDAPNLTQAETKLKEVMQQQYDLLSGYLDEEHG